MSRILSPIVDMATVEIHMKSLTKRGWGGGGCHNLTSTLVSDRGEKGCEERIGVDYIVSLQHNRSTVCKGFWEGKK